MLINGAGWAPSFPRLMTNEQLAVALEKAQQVGLDLNQPHLKQFLLENYTAKQDKES